MQSSLTAVRCRCSQKKLGTHGFTASPATLLSLPGIVRSAGCARLGLPREALPLGDATDVALLRHLLLEVEHTWGTDTKTWLDFDHYTPSDLASMLDTKNYKVVEFSWQEKRQDLFAGIAALPAPLREQAQTAVRNLAAMLPKLQNPSPHPALSDIETPHFIVGIDPKTGAIRRLRNKKTKREWASSDQPLALFSYQTLSQTDYARFFASYVVSEEDWAKKDFGKPNIERFGAESQVWLPRSWICRWRKTSMAIGCLPILRSRILQRYERASGVPAEDISGIAVAP